MFEELNWCIFTIEVLDELLQAAPGLGYCKKNGLFDQRHVALLKGSESKVYSLKMP